MRRRGGTSIVANPVLVGAVTTLVAVVAVFLSYNANNGLPFVPTRQLNVLLPNGSEVVKGNEVRVGGYRAGVVNKMTAVRLPSGQVGAELQLKLDKSVGALPADSRVVVRQRSALGLKYIELDRGSSRKMLPDGATLPIGQGTVPVDLDQIYNMFDRPTRQGSATNLVGFGNTLAGRGVALNQLIQAAPALFGVLTPVAANLSDPRTDLAGFFAALDRTTRTVAPVSGVFAHGFTTQADTFAAIDNSPAALKATISKGPPTLDVATRSFRIQRPFLDHTTAFSHDLAAAAADLPSTLPVVNSALEVGTRVNPHTVALDRELQGALAALDDLVRAPTTNGSLRGLTDTVGTLQPQIRFLGPFITVCNSWTTFWSFIADQFDAETNTGGAQRAMLNSQSQQTDSLGSQGAVLPAAGRGYKPKPDGSDSPQYLHANPYIHAVLPNGKADCEINEGYRNGGNPFSTLPDQAHFKHVVTDTSRIGFSNGPMAAGYDKNGKPHTILPDHVPPGETFTASPGGTAAQVALP